MAYSFDGNDYISVSKQPGTQALTYSFWYKKGTFSGVYREIFWAGTSWPSSFSVFVQHDSSNYMVMRACWSGAVGSWSVDNPSDNTWTNDIWTYDFSSTSNDPVVYRNGSSITVTERTTPSGDPLYDNDGGDLTIGAYWGGSAEYWIGEICEMGLWTRAITAEEASILGKGYSPLFIPNGLDLYTPLIRQPHDIYGYFAGTVSGATVSTHPRIIYPSNNILTYPSPEIIGPRNINLSRGYGVHLS